MQQFETTWRFETLWDLSKCASYNELESKADAAYGTMVVSHSTMCNRRCDGTHVQCRRLHCLQRCPDRYTIVWSIDWELTSRLAVLCCIAHLACVGSPITGYVVDCKLVHCFSQAALAAYLCTASCRDVRQRLLVQLLVPQLSANSGFRVRV